MSTPSIPGVDRDALVAAIKQGTVVGPWLAGLVGDVALAYIAAHHECVCEREHADDEWVEVDRDTRLSLPEGTRMRREWAKDVYDGGRFFVHRDDLHDPDREILLALGDVLGEMGMPPADAGFLTRLIRAAGFDVAPKEER